MDRVKAIIDLYNLALRGSYTVNVDGSRQIQEVLNKAQNAIQEMAQENSDESERTTDEDE